MDNCPVQCIQWRLNEILDESLPAPD
jgi:hypothetical protein